MKKQNPTTAGRRHMSLIAYRDKLSGDKAYKALTKGFKRGSGRNNHGRITTRHKGGGHKRRYRTIDFKLDKKNIPARVSTVEYDPNRSGLIGLLVYRDGEKRYTLLPQDVAVDSEIIASEKAPVQKGNRLPLRLIPVGTFVYNIELKPDGGAKLARSAGAYAQVVANDEGETSLRMPSSEIRKVSENAWASIGEVSNAEHKLIVSGKAGRSRWLGKRPTVRGSAMNPVDHPYGGGEGRAPQGMARSKNKWGRGTRGVKTRKPKKYSSRQIVSRRKKKKRR